MNTEIYRRKYLVTAIIKKGQNAVSEIAGVRNPETKANIPAYIPDETRVKNAISSMSTKEFESTFQKYVGSYIDDFARNNRFLSNFYETPIAFEGLTYRSSEAAFQAAKCANVADRARFTTLDPSAAKHLGRRIQLRKDWNDKRIQVMESILRIKFSNPTLRQKLLDTKDALLIEGNNWKDAFWGVDQSGDGENHLGLLLMQIRNELRTA